jgi:hypothetical protein
VQRRGNDSNWAAGKFPVGMLPERADGFGAIFGQKSGFIPDTEQVRDGLTVFWRRA